ncbi:reverse transcriptase domain-containing protein [Tanacetum coccineum]
MDQPIKQILSRPEKSRRMAKWGVDSREHDITYRPRTSIRGQILADFTYAMRFEFDASNNEAEYEALIAGLLIAGQMGVKILSANVTPAWWRIKSRGRMKPMSKACLQYWRKPKLLIKGFDAFSIEELAWYVSSSSELVIEKSLEGSCSMHSGPRSIVAKAIRSWYYWPTVHREARDMIQNAKIAKCTFQYPKPLSKSSLRSLLCGHFINGAIGIWVHSW